MVQKTKWVKNLIYKIDWDLVSLGLQENWTEYNKFVKGKDLDNC